MSITILTENDWKVKVHEDFDDSLAPKEHETWEKLHVRLTQTLFHNTELPLPPLHQAAFLGYCKAIEKLSTDSKEVNALASLSIFKMTPLHIASANGHLAAARILFQKGADPTCKSLDQTSLDWAMISSPKNLDFLTLFPPNLFLSCTTFFALVKNGDTATLEAILKAGYDINSRNQKKENALHALLDSVNKKSAATMVTWLIERGIDVTAINENGISPLHIALGKSDLLAAEILNNAGASLVVKDQWQNTPMEWALWKGNPEALWEKEWGYWQGKKKYYELKFYLQMGALTLNLLPYGIKAFSLKERIRTAITSWMSPFIKTYKKD